MGNENDKLDPLDAFIQKERGNLENKSTVPPISQSEPIRVPVRPMADGLEKSVRHSLKTCSCEKCSTRRLDLARKWGIVPAENSDQESDTAEDEILDKKALGKIGCIFHTSRYVSLSVSNPQLAKAWEVSEEFEETVGNFGKRLLNKYLKNKNFPYKTELIGGLFVLSDFTARMLHEKKLRIIDKKGE